MWEVPCALLVTPVLLAKLLGTQFVMVIRLVEALKLKAIQHASENPVQAHTFLVDQSASELYLAIALLFGEIRYVLENNLALGLRLVLLREGRYALAMHLVMALALMGTRLVVVIPLVKKSRSTVNLVAPGQTHVKIPEDRGTNALGNFVFVVTD